MCIYKKEEFLTNYEQLAEELNQLAQQINLLQTQLNALPPGKLCIVKGRKYARYYQSDGHTSSYIPSNRRQLAHDLAYKKYLILKSEYLSKEHKILQSCLTHHSNNPDHSQVLLTDNPEYIKLLFPNLQETLLPGQEWMSIPYERNTNYPEQLRFTGTSGNVLRSKSEFMIDSALHVASIPFRYECKLVLGEITLFPDFTILHPKSKKIIYWEHFGMMDNTTYADNTFHKLRTYLANGYIPNVNLLTTYETKSQPLTYDQIEGIIHSFLLR